MKFLLLEFNEIDAGLIDAGIERGELQAFRSFRDSAERYVTDARDELLEPWVQWVTVHTGVPLSRHGAVQLAQGESVPQPFFWETVEAAGHRAWICGAMNARVRPGAWGRVVLDYWTVPEEGSPFRAFNRFVNACVGRPIEERHRVPWREALGFAGFMARNGIHAGTVKRGIGHLLRAAVTRTPWRLVFVLEDCQLDLFLHGARRQRPDLGIFFVNSVAHLQHHYWREMQPELFEGPPVPGRRRHRTAIPQGYRHLDRLLGRLLAAVGERTTVVLCSALGQQPYRPVDGRGPVVYRVPDLDAFVQAFGLPLPSRTIRTMADSFTLEYRDARQAALAVETLRELRAGTRKLFVVQVRDGGSILVEIDLTHAVDDSEPICVGDRPTGVTLREVLRAGHYKSGEHHPRGLLWIRGDFPRPAGAEAGVVPLTAIAPAIERFFGVRSEGPAS